jgi:hypothetical protein
MSDVAMTKISRQGQNLSVDLIAALALPDDQPVHRERVSQIMQTRKR